MKMRKFVLAAGLILMAGAIFYSCQKETNTLPVQDQGVMTLKEGVAYPQDCETYCIDYGFVYQTNTSFTRQWAPINQFPGYFKNNKYFVTTVWNDMDNFYIKVDVYGYQYDQKKVDGDWTLTGPTYDNYPFSSVIITLNGTSYTYVLDVPATTLTKEYALPEGWTGCDEMIYTVRLEGDGQPVWLGTADVPENITYTLFDDESCCIYEGTELTGTLLLGELTFDGWVHVTLTYTFTSEDALDYVKIQGGLTAGGWGVRNVSVNGGEVLMYNGPEGNKNAIIKWEGPIDECGAHTLTVYYERRYVNCDFYSGTWTAKDNNDNLLGEQSCLANNCTPTETCE